MRVTTKHQIIQLFSSDSGKILLLVFLVLLLAFGGVQLNKLVSTNMLRADAISTVSAWESDLLTNTDDIPTVIAGRSPSARTEHLLIDATEVGDIYRFKIIDRTGQTVFSSVRTGFTATPAPSKSIDTNNILQSVLSGATRAEIGVGKSPENTPYFVLCYLPIQKNGEALGVLEVYIDQTEDHAIYQRALLFTESIVAFMVLLAGGIPGFMVHRKMRDHRRAEERVRLQTSQLQAIFDNMTDAIVVVDRTSLATQHNNAASKLLGLPNETMPLQEIGDSFEGLLPTGELMVPAEWPIMRAMHGDYCKNVTLVIRRKDTGASVTTEISTAPIEETDGDGQQKFIVSLHDVTQRNNAQTALKESENLYRSLFETMEEGFCILEVICEPGQPSDFRYLEVNPAFYKQTGMKDMVGKRMREVYPLEDEFWFKLYEGIALTGEPVHIAHDAVAVKGSYQIQAYRIGNPELKRVAVVFSEVSERKQIEETRNRLAAIVESSDDAIIGKNYDGIVTSWNPGAEKIFGYTADEMVGQSILQLFLPGHADEETEILRRLRLGQVVDHLEAVRVRKDGHDISVSLTISPILDADGNVIGGSKIARDITDKIKIERQLQQSQKMDAVGQLTGGIAHDFNNLLAIVIGNLDLLERKISGDTEALQRVRTAQKAALRGADLVRRLLAFSSNETLSPKPTKLHDLIRNVIEMTDRLVGPEIKIATGFNESIPEILVDASGLESALVNLFVNARDAMPTGGTITVSTNFCDLEESYPPILAGELKAGRYACISVSDTGDGMSKQTQERVFEPFFTTKPRGKVTGLGLAMVYGFIKQSNGTVRIYSELGYGTTVTLYLPLAGDASLPVVEVAEPGRSFNGNATVLVVDDEVDLLDIAKVYLDNMGCKAITAVDGNHALQIVERDPGIDLMITDIVMPGGMNGVELAHKVRQLNPKIKIIYCSGFPADALAERSMPLVDGPLLHKPYQRDEFSATVRRVLENKNTDIDESKAGTTI